MPSPPDLKLEDIALVRSVLNGNVTARTQFAERMQCVPQYLSAVNARRGGPLNREDLADLAQDTLVVIWQKLGTFEGRATLETWSWRFCQLEFSNRTRTLFRRQALAAVAFDHAEQEHHNQVAPNTYHDLEYGNIESGLQALGPPAEEIIRMKHFEYLIFEDIAERMKLSPNTVKTRYYRGLLWLRGHLERAGEDGDE